jgi:hypothetical protein
MVDDKGKRESTQASNFCATGALSGTFISWNAMYFS